MSEIELLNLFNNVVSEMNKFDYIKKKKFIDMIKKLVSEDTYITDKLHYLIVQPSEYYNTINPELLNLTYIKNNTIHIDDICSIKYYVDDSNHPVYYCILNNKCAINVRRYYTDTEEDRRIDKLKLFLSDEIKDKLVDKNISENEFANFVLKLTTIEIISNILNYTITYDHEILFRL